LYHKLTDKLTSLSSNLETRGYSEEVFIAELQAGSVEPEEGFVSTKSFLKKILLDLKAG